MNGTHLRLFVCISLVCSLAIAIVMVVLAPPLELSPWLRIATKKTTEIKNVCTHTETQSKQQQLLQQKSKNNRYTCIEIRMKLKSTQCNNNNNNDINTAHYSWNMYSGVSRYMILCFNLNVVIKCGIFKKEKK